MWSAFHGQIPPLFFNELIINENVFHAQIAPVAVSDAAMLAPEEVFTGKGDIKEETELTQAERKRRRANKKRKFKGKLGYLGSFIVFEMLIFIPFQIAPLILIFQILILFKPPKSRNKSLV